MSSSGVEAWFEITIGTFSARRGAGDGEVGVAMRELEHPDRRGRTGESRVRPKSSTERSRCEASRSIRGTICTRSKAARFASIVLLAPAPALM